MLLLCYYNTGYVAVCWGHFCQWLEVTRASETPLARVAPVFLCGLKHRAVKCAIGIRRNGRVSHAAPHESTNLAYFLPRDAHSHWCESMIVRYEHGGMIVL